MLTSPPQNRPAHHPKVRTIDAGPNIKDAQFILKETQGTRREVLQIGCCDFLFTSGAGGDICNHTRCMPCATVGVCGHVGGWVGVCARIQVALFCVYT